jgi:hypothetical protein
MVFRGGEWISDWTVGGGHIKGKVTSNAHYFEEGNI